MSDPGAFPLGLIQQQTARPIDPEQLESFGKQAASMYTRRGTKLNDAVVETVKEARLSPEQVKRVCEFANTSAYLDAFEKAGEVRNITFDGGPADPGVVLRDLNDGSSPAVNHIPSGDYSIPAGHYKLASGGDQMLAEMFGSSLEKTAAPREHHTHQEPVEEVYALHTKVAGAREHLQSRLDTSAVVLHQAEEDLCKVAKTAVLEESTTLGDLANVWAHYSPSSELLKRAMVAVGNHLKERGMSQEDLGASLHKTAQAGRIPNPEHPAVTSFLVFTKLATEHSKLEEAVRVLDEQSATVGERLRRMLG